MDEIEDIDELKVDMPFEMASMLERAMTFNLVFEKAGPVTDNGSRVATFKRRKPMTEILEPLLN